MLKIANNVGQIALGTFEVTSGELVVSDPCYSLGTWCAGTIIDVKNGEWEAKVENRDEGLWGSRCAELVAYHTDHQFNHGPWEKASFDVGVDSGQAGIFDKPFFNSHDEYGGFNDNWYEEVCQITLKDPGAGVLKGGVVSSSGYGDGGYDAFAAKDSNGAVVAVKIVFIPECDEEDSIDDEDEDEEE